jgi:hypothetical protein
MIFNLIFFTVQTKLEVLRQKGFVNQRQRLLSEAPRAFTEISPLTVKDLQLANKSAAPNPPSSLAAGGNGVKGKTIAENTVKGLYKCTHDWKYNYMYIG